MCENSILIENTRKPYDLTALNDLRPHSHKVWIALRHVDLQLRLGLDCRLMGEFRSDKKPEGNGETNRKCVLSFHKLNPPKNLNCDNRLPYFPPDIRERLTYSKYMNTLPLDEKLTILSAMIEGNSIRSTERMTGVHRDTIMRLVTRTGEQCRSFLDRTLRSIRAEKVHEAQSRDPGGHFAPGHEELFAGVRYALEVETDPDHHAEIDGDHNDVQHA